LSYPVIWSEGVEKELPGDPAMAPILLGEWWYQWGINGVDPNIVPASAPPDPDASDPALNPDNLPLYDDGIPGSVDLALIAGTPLADSPLPLAKAYLQKDPLNVWQAGSALPAIGEAVNIDIIDWGDNLESVDWYTRSQVRTEIVLYEDAILGDVESYFPVDSAMLEYTMRHTDGWGIDEVHGMATALDDVPILGPGTSATVYSHCARLTIQKLLVPREAIMAGSLVWVPKVGWTESDPNTTLINPPIFNMAVYEGTDGTGYYSSEINVKGKIIYGYTWNVRQLNDSTDGTAAGDYRITFSFDPHSGIAPLNTYFVEGTTEILVPLEEEQVAAFLAESEEPGGGGIGLLDFDENLTFMDVRILERTGGGGGSGKGKSK
jgi:hypothetical protein